jgi:hypothetical protein
MSKLQSLQNQFQNYLLKDQPEIQKSIVHTEKVSVNQRLFIYLDGYRCRLIDSLASNFPIISTYLGFDEFRALSSDYIAKYPSTYRSIRWFGDTFADFLKENGQTYLAELAEFEWKMTLAFDAADEEALKVEEMAAVPPDAWANVRFKPHASLQLMNFSWNTVQIWEAISHEKKPPKPKKYKPVTWALWRKDYLNRFYSLAEDEAWALEALSKGATFAELCEGLCNWFEEQEVGMRAASLLKGWIESGLIAGIEQE